jgi:catechol 2,3-dioxygenase-like lactoylglutathione lyase family enzyme
MDTSSLGQVIPTQAVHHITLVGANRQTSIDFWQGLLGMPFVFEQPNLDNPDESHLYFDPGDGRLITIFTDETRTPNAQRVPQDIGAVHHIAFEVSQSTFEQIEERFNARKQAFIGPKDRGFMKSIYFRDPLGLLIELAHYTFTVPEGFRTADVMINAHRARVAEGAFNIQQRHIALAIEHLTRTRDTL